MGKVKMVFFVGNWGMGCNGKNHSAVVLWSLVYSGQWCEGRCFCCRRPRPGGAGDGGGLRGRGDRGRDGPLEVRPRTRQQHAQLTGADSRLSLDHLLIWNCNVTAVPTMVILGMGL